MSSRLRPLSSATDLTEQTDQTLEPDPDNRSLGSDFDPDSQSISSSLWQQVHQYGRTYHTFCAGAYPFPNDERENARLDTQHDIFKVLFWGRNWFAPINRLPYKGRDKPHRVLDIGCGTGKWCMEMAKEFPRYHFEGIDLSPIQPTQTPYNLLFYLDDIRRSEWWECDNPAKLFSYIHTRMSLGIFADFREIIQKGFNNLEPGGWMESQELYPTIYCEDGTMPEDWALLQWSKKQDEAAMQLGRPLRIANKLKRWYEQAGFVDVHEREFRIPVNEWALGDRIKLLGKFMQWNMQDGIYGWSADYFVKAFQETPEEVHVNCAYVHKSLNDRSVHAYYKTYVVWGRKPREDEPPSQVPKPEHWPTKETSLNDRVHDD